MTGSQETPSFRLAYVPGVTPSKWVRIWHERLPDVPLALVPVPAGEAAELLRGRGADAGFLRLPVDRTDLSAIPLYTEATVVVVPKDHLLTAADEVSAADLAEEVVLHPLDDSLYDGAPDALDDAARSARQPPGLLARQRPATTADAVELVAAGVGVLVVPQSLARLHHRRDLTYRPVADAPQSQVALSWREDATTDLVDDFIGIVRGRTANSSRGRAAQAGATGAKDRAKGDRQDKKSDGRQGGKSDGRQSGKPGGKSGGQPRRSGRGTASEPSGGGTGKPAAKRSRAASGTPRPGRRGKRGGT